MCQSSDSDSESDCQSVKGFFLISYIHYLLAGSGLWSDKIYSEYIKYISLRL